MIYYYDSNDAESASIMGQRIQALLTDYMDSDQELVILCIGSDRSTGDCLGPVLGYKLNQIANRNFFIYGSLEHPVHAGNLTLYMNGIKAIYNNPFIIAIDASLGKQSHVGYITLGTGPLKPGLGVKKRLPEVGDLHITGIVNNSCDADYTTLQTTRLSTIMKIVDVIYDAICNHLDIITG
ncbi:MAG: spore protease YyaC [Lachnospira sp.]